MCVFIIVFEGVDSQHQMLHTYLHPKMLADEMEAPWDPRGCYQGKNGGPKQYTACAKCGHIFTDWVRKKAIEKANKQDKAKHDKEMAVYNKSDNKKSVRKPSLKQQSLLMRCACITFTFSRYGGNCPQKCNGSEDCEICNCACSFVCKTTNYNQVMLALALAKGAAKSISSTSAAQSFLSGGINVRESAKANAATLFDSQKESGMLGMKEDTARAVSQHASLAMANHFVNNPPAHQERAGLVSHMNSLEHQNGPSWISMNGVAVNLAGTGAKSRVNNNRLKDSTQLLEEEAALSDGSSVVYLDSKPAAQVVLAKVAGKKPAPPPPLPSNPDEEKVKRMLKQCKSGINFDVDVDDLDEKEEKKHTKEMKALSAYASSIRKGTTSSIVQMVGDDDDDDEWAKGQSQNMHKRFVNARGYEHMDE